MLARAALKARVKKEMPKRSPIEPTEANLLAGAPLYQQHCAVCHGLPGETQTAIAQGMFPPPPQLFHGKGVTDDEPGESYWKVFNGIRLTGMPSFKDQLSATEMWQVSLLLAYADKPMPPTALQILHNAPAPPTGKHTQPAPPEQPPLKSTPFPDTPEEPEQ